MHTVAGILRSWRGQQRLQNSYHLGRGGTKRQEGIAHFKGRLLSRGVLRAEVFFAMSNSSISAFFEFQITKSAPYIVDHKPPTLFEAVFADHDGR